MRRFSISLQGFAVALTGLVASAAHADVESRFLIGAAAFDAQCLTPIREGHSINPSLKSAGEQQWWLSNGVILKAIKSSKGPKGCQIYPSAGQDVAGETLEAIVENFDFWATSEIQAGMLREYQNCKSLGVGVRRVLDTPSNPTGDTVRVVFQTDPEISHFVLIAAKTNVTTPPSDCAS
ncbi:MAG: hypothetical protein WBC85_05820 [Planktotalea sp.]|uniref:hypothetical protein n=1 Tax=Planktotalea sp. TaxID=2029877 RepID=UPI003C718380